MESIYSIYAQPSFYRLTIDRWSYFLFVVPGVFVFRPRSRRCDDRGASNWQPESLLFDLMNLSMSDKPTERRWAAGKTQLSCESSCSRLGSMHRIVKLDKTDCQWGVKAFLQLWLTNAWHRWVILCLYSTYARLITRVMQFTFMLHRLICAHINFYV